MRRYRRNRPTWFPVLGTDSGDGLPAGTTNQFYNNIPAGTETYTIGPTEVVELLRDEDVDENATNQSLRDRVEGKDYAIARIVGKVWGGLNQYAPETTAPGETVAQIVTICAAMAVLPVDNQGNPEGIEDDYNPLYARNSAKPYMWRRTWTLYNNLVVGVEPGIAGAPYSMTGPTNIENCGVGLMDGPHVDCKSKRRVRKEERLFLLQTWQLQATSSASSATNAASYFHFGYDLRILGGMRKSRNKSVLT